MNYAKVGTIALAALALSAAPARAQFPFHLGITGGITFPTGDQAQAQDHALNGGALIAFHAPMTPFGLRADASLHHFPGKDQSVGGQTISASTNMWMTTADVTFDAPLPLPVKPYIIAGMGIYGSITTVNGVPGSSSDTNFGINGGLGVQLTRLFVEARWHRINTANSTSATVVPLTVGIMF
jgi:hypothetical protein